MLNIKAALVCSTGAAFLCAYPPGQKVCFTGFQDAAPLRAGSRPQNDIRKKGDFFDEKDEEAALYPAGAHSAFRTGPPATPLIENTEGNEGTENNENVENNGETSTAEFSIGVIQLASHTALDAAREGFVAGLDEAGLSYEIEVLNAAGEQANCPTLATKLVNDQVDLILAIATPAAQAAAQATDTIPILVTAVTDPAYAGLVESNDAPGGNVSGTSDMNPVEDQIELLLTLVPETKTVGLLYNAGEDNSICRPILPRKFSRQEHCRGALHRFRQQPGPVGCAVHGRQG